MHHHQNRHSYHRHCSKPELTRRLTPTKQRYISPLVTPPTPEKLEQDKETVDEQFEKAFLAARAKLQALCKSVDYLNDRVSTAMKVSGLEPGTDIEWAVCKGLWEGGIVADLILVPFTSLRQVRDILAGRA